MGIRIPTPVIDRGTDCSTCTGADKPWAVGKTPEVVYTTFTLMNPSVDFVGTLPNHHSFPCHQVDGWPCWWKHLGSVWYVSFYAKIPAEHFSELLLVHVPSGKLAFQAREAPCPFEFLGFQNLIVDEGLFTCAMDGIGVVSWNELPQSLIANFGLHTSPRLHLEVAVHEDGDRVLKFCDRRDATNIKIKFTP